MAAMPDQVAKRILQLCRDERFALAGVCPARPSDHPEALRAWLASQGQNPVGVGGLSLGGVITEVLA